MIDRIHAALRQVCQLARTRSMYPHGHPSRTAAADVARHVLMDLFRFVARVDLMVSLHGLTCEGEALPDEDGSLRRMASFLRRHRIGSITIERGLTDEEADLLLDLVAAAGGAEDNYNITQQLAETETEFLHLAEIDYESYVPASEAGAHSPERESDSGAPGGSPDGLPDTEFRAASGVTLLELLEDPRGLTEALLSCTAVLGEEQSDEVGAGPSGEVDVDGVPLSAADELGELEAAGVALARAVQRFAEAACNAQPQDQDGVFAKLAAALRRMEPQLLAFAFRADVVGPEAPFDSLRETARYLTTGEAVEIVCAPLGVMDAEPLEVCGRLIDRLGPTRERLIELSAALREALAERGVSADGLVTVLEASLQQGPSPQTPPPEPVAASPVPPLRRTPENVRADRRAALADRLPSASQAESRARRIAACAELLVLPQLPSQFPALLADLRESLSGVADDLRPELETVALKALAEAAQPSSPLSAECKTEARSLIDDIAGPRVTELLRQSLGAPHSKDRLRALRALSLIRQGGYAAVAHLLVNGQRAQGEQEVSAITVMLVDAEEAGVTGPVSLSDVIASPACRHAASVIHALAARGGQVAHKHLTVALAHGEYAVRRTVVDAAGQAETPITEVLVMALEDAEEDISAAAVRYLADSGDPQAPRHLLAVLRAGSALRPRFGRRTAAADALGRLKYEAAVDCLVGILQRPSLTRRTGNDRLRAAATAALVEIGTPPALHAVAARQRGERSAEIREVAALVAERLADNQPETDHGKEDANDAV